jgi:dihydrofolate synthase/folylpolyglutamate synthase
MYPGEAGLLRMRRLYQRLVEVYKPRYQIIHVAGTSGKGSTTIMTAKILKALGLKVGIFINPYLYDEHEYMQVNNVPIGLRMNIRLKKEVEELAKDVQVPEIGTITFFEKLTARALIYFVKKNVDIAVIETAMGGSFDATNVVESDVAVIGPISVDHARILGKDRAHVAVHKAGIIKASNKKVVVGRQHEDAQQVIEAAAKKQRANTSSLGKDFEVSGVVIGEKGTAFSYRGFAAENNARIENIALSLIGAHQADNAAVSITAARALLGPAYDFEKFAKGVKKALKKVKNPGRFDIRHHKKTTVIIDVAHNPEKINAMVTTFQTLYPGKKTDLIFSCKWTKDVTTMAQLLKPIVNNVYLTTFTNKDNPLVNRVMEKDHLTEAFKQLDMKIAWFDNAHDAYATALAQEPEFLLIAGSFHLLREIHQD